MSIVSGTNSSDWCQKKHAKRALSLDDRYRMASLRAHCLSIRLDRKLFRPMIERLRALRESEALQMEPIKADAPSERMRRCFGLGGLEYARLRRMLVASPAVGRPPEPDEDTAHRLWRELAPPLEASGPGGPGPETYLWCIDGPARRFAPCGTRPSAGSSTAMPMGRTAVGTDGRVLRAGKRGRPEERTPDPFRCAHRCEAAAHSIAGCRAGQA